MRNTLTSKLLTASAVGALTLGAAACSSDETDDLNDDPIEDVGDSVVDGVEDVGDGVEDVGDSIVDE